MRRPVQSISVVVGLAGLSCAAGNGFAPAPAAAPIANVASTLEPPPTSGTDGTSRHRVLGLGVELAYGQSITGFPYSGYGYVPVAQGGPDVLYQLQAINDFTDSITSSALLLVYPIALAARGRACVDDAARFVCTDGLFAVGFGPTFLQGGTANFARQWNLRAGLGIVPHVLLLTGPSWRTMGVSSEPSAYLGSLVSVPRPASTPLLTTVPRADIQWSLGIAVDLAVLPDLVSAAAKAVTGRSCGANR